MADTLPTPITRQEQFLAAAAGATGITLPTPITNEEQYLAAIAENGSGGGTAESVSYDNASSGLEATNVQDAIDEVAQGSGGGTAASVSYDNTTSGLEATDVQGAIDELAQSSGGDVTKQYVDDGLALKLDRTDLTISEEIVLYADKWVDGKNYILFPRDLNDTFILMPVSIDDWQKYGIKVFYDEHNTYIEFICDIIPPVNISIKIATIKPKITKNADTKISNITYDTTNHKYYCTNEYNVNNSFDFIETGIIAISSQIALTTDEANMALNLYSDDITAHSINEPLTIATETGLYWYVRSYVIYETPQMTAPLRNSYEYIEYSDVVQTIDAIITKLNNTARSGICAEIITMEQNPETPTKLHVRSSITLPNISTYPINHGFIATCDAETANEGLTLDTQPVANVTYIKDYPEVDKNSVSFFYNWNKTNALGQTWWARPFVILSDGETETTIYGRMESFTMPSA